ncbi:hypothetical protein GOA89_33170 [Sinorhizobium meliloti]|nr:hypothetical protein [Sinorhizobium meliloti]MDW9850938.1 hypothetical protein [Sinorhizobium meliloti]MDX0147738.1 hypothetical protein [Sinorhizobium meliloti]MDX0154021.1 hypothetical protein [Sinorhizobium meliloti]MDX0172953.1 hypothetical protein [Sinorhizobium meliloti]
MKKISPHLRLVASDALPTQAIQEKVTISKRKPKPGEQLSFDLEHGQEKRVILVAMAALHGQRFTELIASIKPKIVLDTRHAIRFDLPGTSRSHVFAKLASVHAFYTKASIPWHELRAEDFMVERGPLSQRLHHEILEREEDCIMVLLSDAQHLRLFRSYLNRQLSSSSSRDWTIEEAV